MSLEDEFSDVIAKAMRGLELDVRELAAASGVAVSEIGALLGGEMNDNAAKAICPALGLDADALVALPGYLPEPVDIAGIRRIVLPFRRWTVNAWEIHHEGVRLLFDAGFGERDILEKVETAGLDALLITHSHPDHIGGLEALAESEVRVISETEALESGDLQFGSLRLEAVDLSGHFTPTAGYFISGLGRQLFVSGDAIFAGSMGGCGSRASYDLASTTLRQALAAAEPDCIILPGHGPATTVAEELVSNPFHPRFH
jgi:hydroxyacylglutathione hydrolase